MFVFCIDKIMVNVPPNLLMIDELVIVKDLDCSGRCGFIFKLIQQSLTCTTPSEDLKHLSQSALRSFLTSQPPFIEHRNNLIIVDKHLFLNKQYKQNVLLLRVHH